MAQCFDPNVTTLNLASARVTAISGTHGGACMVLA